MTNQRGGNYSEIWVFSFSSGDGGFGMGGLLVPLNVETVYTSWEGGGVLNCKNMHKSLLTRDDVLSKETI